MKKELLKLSGKDFHNTVKKSEKQQLRKTVEMQRHWAAIICDHNNGEGFWIVDAWETDDENEEGKSIAVIDEISKNVYYIDPIARTDYYAQEVIQDVLANI